MQRKVMAFLHEERGLTMVEYAVAGGLIVAAAVAAFTGLGAAVAAQIVTLTGYITGGGGG